MKNKDLTSKYDKIYAGDAYKNFYSFSSFPHSKLIVDMLPNWEGLEVIEIGCGEGRLASMLSFAGAKMVDAVDFSSEAIKIAQNTFKINNISFICKDYREIKKKYDVVVLDGVLEHLDDPLDELHTIIEKNLRDDGVVIIACPSFLNPRGYIWMTLNLLFDVPMSLTDLHFLCPFDFEEFCNKYGYKIVIKSTYQDWGAGERTIIDFNKRLRNALKDAGLDNTKVDKLLDWLRKAVKYFKTDDFSGAIVVYKISKA